VNAPVFNVKAKPFQPDTSAFKGEEFPAPGSGTMPGGYKNPFAMNSGQAVLHVPDQE